MYEIREANTKKFIMFYIENEKRMVANAMFSVFDTPLEFGGRTFPKHIYFGRLFVDPKDRNKGLAKWLLARSMEYIQQMGIPAVCEINPYGDLDYDQLKELYMRYGFQPMRVRSNGYDYETLIFHKENVDDEE